MRKEGQKKKCGNKRGERQRKRRQCQRYRLECRREKNKIRKLHRHLRRQPTDKAARTCLAELEGARAA